MRHLLFFMMSWVVFSLPVESMAQNRVRAVSAPGPIEIYEPVIALSGPSVASTIKLVEDDWDEKSRALIISLKTLSSQLPVTPHLMIECVAKNDKLKSKVWLVWLEPITKPGEHVFRWPLDDQQLNPEFDWHCRVEVLGERAEPLSEVKEIGVPCRTSTIE